MNRAFVAATLLARGYLQLLAGDLEISSGTKPNTMGLSRTKRAENPGGSRSALNVLSAQPQRKIER